jgi:hypothetical protein
MQHDRPDFPTMEQVEEANHEQLARWYRFLSSGDTKEQGKIMDRIAERFKRLGGMTPAWRKRSVSEPNFCYRLATTFAYFLDFGVAANALFTRA